MPRILIRSAAAFALAAGLVACSSDSKTAPATTASTAVADTSAASTEASTATSTGASTGATTAGSTGTVAPPATDATPTTATPTTDTAPAGDGKWHPVVAADADVDPVVPPLVEQLFAGQPVSDAIAGSTSFYEVRSYALFVDAACDTVAPAVAAAATAQGLQTIANGSIPGAAAWLVVSDGQYDGANLSFVPGSADGTCEVDGLPFSPVRLTFDGPTTGTYNGFVGVGCGALDNQGITLGIWGAPVNGDATNAALLWVTTTDGVDPGPHTVRDVDQSAFVLGQSWTLSQIVAEATTDRNSVPGLNSVTGTVTMSEGLASGTLDVMANGEHITGTFACGTPLYTPPVVAPPDTGVPTTDAVAPPTS
ncbi:MAG: hypothetical protein JWM34_1537 [Ilumatobacteraceae bacterium]|nr:hypothetical protein [Ilumatobacteraceae bacterium]